MRCFITNIPQTSRLSWVRREQGAGDGATVGQTERLSACDKSRWALPVCDAWLVLRVFADEMPQAASKELKKSVNSVDAAKRELKRAATLKAAASVDEKRADGLEGRLAELVKYQHAKQRYADAQEGLARQADAEYKAEEDEVDAMEGSHAHAEEELHGSRGVEGTHNDGSGGSGVTTSLQQRLRRHLPLLRVVDKLVQRVGAGGHRRPRGRHPRSRHQLPAQRGGH